MVARHAGPVVLVSAVLLGGGVVVELTAHGPGAVIGFALLGAVLGAWAVVYDLTMCKAEPIAWSLVAAGAGVGAAVLPAVASLQIGFGDLVWASVLIVAVLWSLMNSVRWADKRPHRSIPA